MTDDSRPHDSRRDLNLAAWEGASTRAWLSLTQGSFLRGFLLHHGIGNFALAILDNLPLVTLLVQPLATLGLARSPRLRTLTMRALWLERLAFLLPILTVLLLRWPGLPWWTLLLLGVSYGAAAVALSGWVTWMAELTEGHARGAFVARRSAYDAGLAIVLGLSSSALVDWLISAHGETLGYLTIFLLAGFFGIATPAILGRIRHLPTAQTALLEADWHFLQRPWRSASFKRYLGYILVLGIGQSISGPFWIVYMLQELHWGFVQIAIYGTIATVSSLLCYRWWGHLADRVGTIPLLRVITFARILNPILWIFLTPDNAWVILIPEAIMTGVFVAGLSPLQLVYVLKEAQGEDRAAYLSIYHGTQGLAALIGALIGGGLMTWLVALAHPWGPDWVFQNYHVVFLLTASARFFAPLILTKLREPDALHVHELWPVLRESLRITPARPKSE